jgi:dynein heavy chain
LTLKLIISNQSIVFENKLNEVQNDLKNVVEQIVNQSQNLPRPENTISKAEKMHLWAVQKDDEIVTKAKNTIEDIIEQNLNVVEKCYSIYDEYIFILKEDARIEKFLSENEDKDARIEEINKYLATIKRIKEELPFEIRMNMFLIDCNNLKNVLVTKCEDLINTILQSISMYIINTSNNISKRCSNNKEILSKPISSASELVQTEEFLERYKDTEKSQITEDYFKVVNWLMTLYEYPSFKAQEDEIKAVIDAHSNTNDIERMIEQKEQTYKEKRTEQEEKIGQQKTKFLETLEEIKRETDDFKEKSDVYQAKDNQKEIANINTRLAFCDNEKVDINRQEEIIGFEVTEFNQVAELQRKIKPYDQLWNLYCEQIDKMGEWKKTPFHKLDPEELDKDHKRMFQASNGLKNTFEKQKLPNPLKVAESINKTLFDFRKFIPIIGAVCTNGLKDRHWDKFHEILENPDKNKDNINFRNVDLVLNAHQHEVKELVNKLEESADTAAKEYKNETMMKNMKSDWEEVNYHCKKWKESFILEGEAVEEIQTYLDDHIVKTQTMKGSPYAKFMLDDILEWEKKLLKSQDNLEVWLKVQSVWLYLAPVFSSEDIMKQMPVEGRNFKEVDRAWKNMMIRVNEKPAAMDVMDFEELGEIVNSAHAKLEQVQKGLNDYLESKRKLFPRFFFLSNDELLEILSETKEPLKVQPHLKKCFEGIAALEFDEEKKIHGMYSSEKEHVPFKNIIDPIAARGCVEQWLSEVEETMIKSVKDVCENAIQDYPKKARDKWILNWQGQAVLSGSMVFWTEESETAMNNSGVQGLQDYLKVLNDQLNDTVGVVRKEIDKLQRSTLEALIVLDVHNKDVIQNDLISNNINDPNEFLWLAQMRYYWMDNDIWVKITNAIMDYNYEYLGNSARLVITPLTDRCYRTLCGAIHLNYGGAPEGPAGTGKTETVKDLSKALARQCVVFNCSDGLDYLQMGKFFKGLASCGAWSCFDEFNRIDLEVLSVIAQQLQTIQKAVDLKKEKFDFEGSIIPLKLTCNCFITMNPGYAGRSDLPDNLKALFRTVAMMVPDYGMIAEIVLYSYGFTEAKPLSGKIVTTYTLCSEQLSSQKHYDYGMRAVKSVLVAAGQLKRKYMGQKEAILLLRAINDVNLAKFLVYDVPLFQGITSDLFPGIELPTPDYGHLMECIKNNCKKRNLQEVEYFLTKTIQLYETITVRHGLMIVGRPFSGKTSAINVLADALTEMNEKGLMNEMKTVISTSNPKAVSLGHLYGNFDEVSHDWSDGVLAVLYRQFANNPNDDLRKWLHFDGPVDAIWIENMNTVLDDNRKLCLMSGEIIQMSPNMNLIFEPMDLEVASPATVSRCGMIFLEPELMGWQPLFRSWMNELPEDFTEEITTGISELVHWMVPPVIEFVREHAKETTPTQDQNLARSCLRIFRILLKMFDEDKTKMELPLKEIMAIIDGSFMFSIIWSICVSINTEYRKACNDCIKKLLQGDLDTGEKPLKKIAFPDRGTIYDYVFFPKENKWLHWSDLIDKGEKISKELAASEVIVTTSDKVKYSYLLEMLINNRIPTLYVGPTGTGKSVYIQNVLQNVLPKDKFSTIEVGFSAQTSAYQTQEIIDGKLDKRKKDHFGPRYGMECVIHVDDLNMPKVEEYGAQPPIELLRQFLDQKGWYDIKDTNHPFRNIIDTMLI